MLPILRILPVGGVLLAILILLLALTPPGGAHPPLSPAVIAARGPLIDRDEHPEWRQFVIEAALRRAGELNRLRELPDTPTAPSEPVTTDPVTPENPPAAQVEPELAQPVIAEPVAPPPGTSEAALKQFAGLPADRGSADPDSDDATGSVDEAPGATIPIDIGETSSTELPVVLPEEKPPVIRTPERAKPARESRRRRVRRVQQVKVEPPLPPPLSFFDLLFGTAKPQPPRAPVLARTVAPKKAAAAKPKRQARAATN